MNDLKNQEGRGLKDIVSIGDKNEMAFDKVSRGVDIASIQHESTAKTLTGTMPFSTALETRSKVRASAGPLKEKPQKVRMLFYQNSAETRKPGRDQRH